MEKIQLHSTDLMVSPLCFGQAFIGIEGRTDQEAWRLMDIFKDEGGNLLDTAHVYSDWVPGEMHRSERIVGDFLKRPGNREKFVLCSKGCHYDLETNANRVTGACFLEDLDGSLKSLQTDYIDIYFFHRDNPDVPVGELLEAADSARKSGKIRYYGASNWSAERIEEAAGYAAAHGLYGFVANQVTLHAGVTVIPRPKDQTVAYWDKSFADWHRKSGMTAMACSSLAQGVFFAYGNPAMKDRFDELCTIPGYRELAEKFARISKETGISISQLCLRYIIDYPGFQTIPLFTAFTEAHLRDALEAIDKNIPPNCFRWL